MNIENILKARAGDFTNINGEVFVMRDQIQKRILSGQLNIDLKDKIIYYCGPIIKRHIVLSCGPTTANRMEYGIPFLIRKGVKVFIGKGSLNQQPFQKKAVYLLAAGGAGTYLAQKVTCFKILAYPELGPEALISFYLKDFPVLVGIDLKGNSIFKKAWRT